MTTNTPDDAPAATVQSRSNDSSTIQAPTSTRIATWLQYNRTAILIGIAATLTSILALAAPLAIRQLTRSFDLEPSEIAAGYQAASALVSATALCALATSLWYQVKQTRVSQNEAARSLQLDLVKMALDDPVFSAAVGWNTTDDIHARLSRQHVYLNQWFMYMQMNFETDGLSESGIRSILQDEFFQGLGVEFWRQSRHRYIGEADRSANKKRFVEIVDSEFQDFEQRQVEDSLQRSLDEVAQVDTDPPERDTGSPEHRQSEVPHDEPNAETQP